MIYAYILAALALFGSGFGVAWELQGNTYEAKIGTMKVEASKKEADAFAAQTKAVNQVRADEQAKVAKYQGALNEARTREISISRERDAARNERDSLRDQVSSDARRLARADTPAASVLEYATAAGELLVDCSRRYQEVAGKADGHATDLRTFLEAWPVTAK